MTTVAPAAPSTAAGPRNSGLYDVLELILDRGLVIDAFVRVSLVGIEILKIDVRVVVASVDTYLRFAEACNRLDLESGASKEPGVPELVGSVTESGARGKSKGAIAGAAESIADAFRSGSDSAASGDTEKEPRKGRRTTTGTRREKEAAE
ncbi:gas vesicle structural protein GvpA [Streptomyces sp. NPDC127098]|uniref:gas vesicle structural protein GvpA n=1 Tax=Streptomyces sp. NPDC127098 TaxID=3347137 RepID=UPI003661242E